MTDDIIKEVPNYHWGSGKSVCDFHNLVRGAWNFKEGGEPMTDDIKHPAYYTRGKIEVWDFILDQNLDYLLGNVVKYICRAGHKDDVLKDLQKAMAFLEKKIATLQNKKEDSKAPVENPSLVTEEMIALMDEFNAVWADSQWVERGETKQNKKEDSE
jgi:hypothetical protein